MVASPIDAYIGELRKLLAGRLEAEVLERTVSESREHLEGIALSLGSGSVEERELRAIRKFGPVKTLARKLAIVHMPRSPLLREAAFPLALAIIGAASLCLIPYVTSSFIDHTLSWKVIGINIVQITFGIACLRSSRLLVPVLFGAAGVLFVLLTIWNAAFNVVTPKYGDTTPRWAIRSEKDNAVAQRQKFLAAIEKVEKGTTLFASSTPLKDAGEYGHEGNYKRLFDFSPVPVAVYSRGADGILRTGVPAAATWREAQMDWALASPSALRTYREQVAYYDTKIKALEQSASAIQQLPLSAATASRSALIFFVWFSIVDVIAYALRRLWLSFRMPPRSYKEVRHA